MAEETQSPEQARDRLLGRLVASLPNKLRWLAWYYGNQAPPVVPKQYEAAYKLIQDQATNPWAGLVVDALNQRMKVEGFATGDETLNAQLWRIFRANQFDANQRLVFGESLTYGAGYISTWPSAQDPKVAIMAAESALQVQHEPDPENHRRALAAIKLWYDTITKRWYATLYTPTNIYKWTAERVESKTPAQPVKDAPTFAYISHKDLGKMEWTQREVEGEEYGAENPLESVPMVPIVNRPTLHAPERGISEIGAVESILSRIDKITLDMLLTSEIAAYRQRWATGLAIPEDKEGNPIEPFKAAVDRLWISTSSDTQFGTFEASDLDQYLKARNSEIEALAANARIPSFYLASASLVNPPSAEAMRAAEAGLVSKIEDSTAVYAEGLEQSQRLVIKIEGLEQPDNIGVLWKNPETRNDAQTADAALKMSQLQVPLDAIWRFMGATPDQIVEWKAQAAASTALDLLLATQATESALGDEPAPAADGDEFGSVQDPADVLV